MNIGIKAYMNDCQQIKVRLLWDFIDKIFHLKDSQVKGLSFIPPTNTMRLGMDNELHLNFQSQHNKELFDDLFKIPSCVLPEIKLLNSDYTFVIPSGYAICDSPRETDNNTLDMDIIISRVDYGSIADKSNYYWRYVFPIRKPTWGMQIDTQSYVDDSRTYFERSYLKLIIEDTEMHVFLTSRKDESYMVIQSGIMIDSEEMYKRVNAITTSLGLITGNKYGDYHFQIASIDKDFDSITSLMFGSLEETKQSGYLIVNNRWADTYAMLGQYEYQQYAQEILIESGYDFKSFYDNRPVESKVFEGLVNLLYNNNDLAISASMLLEGGYMKMIYQTPFFHVALETITSVLIDGTQEGINPPLEKKEFNRKVKPVLLEALNGITELPDDAKRIYTLRIGNNLNSCANQDKLFKCFDIAGYNLTEEDKDAIQKRNFTLHGHLSDITKKLQEQQWDIFAVALRLHKLCCILLLKAAGYTGRILNNEVIFGVKEACNRKDLPYIYI